MNLKELRKKCKMTQVEAASFVGIPLRTYSRYESGQAANNLKLKAICDLLENKCLLDEEHGLLTVEEIIEISTPFFEKYNITYAYLFGSYSRGSASEKSDVDILISDDVTGLDYFGLVEELRINLHKVVDLVRITSASKNPVFINEIFESGILIYKNHKTE